MVVRHALQGIHGPESDRELLLFLAAYLRSPLARFFLFHMTSSWEISIAEVDLDELLTVPFRFAAMSLPLPALVTARPRPSLWLTLGRSDTMRFPHLGKDRRSKIIMLNSLAPRARKTYVAGIRMDGSRRAL